MLISKNSWNHDVTLTVPAKNVKFKMATRNHVTVHKSAVYVPISAIFILVSISMFWRSINAIKHMSHISRDVFLAKNSKYRAGLRHVRGVQPNRAV